MNDQPALDAFDLAILNILQVNCTTPQRLIGESVNLSAPAVQRRIKRLEEAGVIRANVAFVDPMALGKSLTLVVEVELVSHSAALIEQVKRIFQDEPRVQQCYYVTGDFDFVLLLIVASMAEYESLTNKLFHSNPNVKRYRTMITVDRVKVGLQVPV
jgi:Lrp/AsnC family leucine-responsive transcriptional regulator